MQRRTFVKSALMAGGGLAVRQMAGQDVLGPGVPNEAVRRVLVMFKCHFDAGFIDTQAHVVRKYFDVYFPQAIEVARQVRAAGNQRYVWTTGSWLLYEYLEQASGDALKRMEEAIGRGDIAWHALPFSWQTELMDRSTIEGSLAISRALDARFGRVTTGAKMTDVPGHTRGLVGPLAEHGVTFLDIGVNGGSRPAELPPMFLWKDPNGAELAVMYHHEYGATTVVPGTDLAIAVVVRDDNTGPHTPEEVATIYATLGKAYPKAEIAAADLTEIANAVVKHHAKLPVVTQEIGDTWIHGVASDPLKLARYRELQRLRAEWMVAGRLKPADDLAMLRHTLLEVEHTWGTDTKTWLDFDHYTPKALAGMLHTKNYEVVQYSWEEKRKDLFDGIDALPAGLREEALARMAALDAKVPQMPRGVMHDAAQEIDTEHYVLALDATTGAIRRLKNKKTGREWATAENPLALFSYQTLSSKEYDAFFDSYIIAKADWVAKDFGKPNMDKYGAVSRTWLPSLEEVHVETTDAGHRVLARLAVRGDAQESAAYPRRMFLELWLPKDEAVVHANFSWFDKPATRLPEALWLSFQPKVEEGGQWWMDKTDQEVSPKDVVRSGNRHRHAVGKGVRYKGAAGTFSIETPDAPLFALGVRSPLLFGNDLPDPVQGVHCNLLNNAWGTNYIMWFGQDMRYRFVLRG